MAKILVVDDDLDLLSVVSQRLQHDSHAVDTAKDGFEAIEFLKLHEYDLLILDWNLRAHSGIDILKSYRQNGGIAPVLVLTGKSSIADKATGFDAGADDYLTKPFHIREISMRVKALLKRSGPPQAESIKIKDLQLDCAQLQVFRAGKCISLHRREFSLLELLMRNPGRVYTAEELLDKLWTSTAEVQPNAVAACVLRLRKKIDMPGEESLIKTVYGVGYKIDP